MDSDFNWLHFVTEPDNLTGGIGDAHSFTALLTLPGNLVQHTKFCSEDGVPADWRQVTPQNSNSVDNVKFGVTMFPSDVAFVEREARFSSFAKGDQIPKARDVRGNEIPKATDSEAEDRDAESASSKKRKTEKKAVNSEPLDSAKTKDVLNRKSKGKAEQRKRENDRNLKAPAVLEKQNYIHVRSRRGQATDSHSLAERVRREKISERMKVLQDLVPGCNKITGKALMLDEIINHVQSLQHQVEFLSMKLATVNFKFHSDRDQMIAGVSPAFTGLPCHRFEPSLLQTVADVPCARDTEVHHSRLQPPFPSGQSIPGHFPFSHLI